MSESAHTLPAEWTRFRRDGDNSGNGFEGWGERLYKRWGPGALFDLKQKGKLRKAR